MGIFFFFFFQAEDGIRDFHVTGVQTCALPIWPRNRLLVGIADQALHGIPRPMGIDMPRWSLLLFCSRSLCNEPVEIFLGAHILNCGFIERNAILLFDLRL